MDEQINLTEEKMRKFSESKESCETISLPTDTLDEICTTMKHARTFITSREKMHQTGVNLYDELLERLTSHLNGRTAPLNSTLGGHMKAAIDIATKEINWHESHYVDGPSDEYKRGFINGLYHLRNLFTVVIDTSQQAVQADAESQCACPLNESFSVNGHCYFCGKKRTA